MPTKWCVSCNSYQNSMYDKCQERCGGDDCRERCYNCKKLFSGELVRGEYSRNISSSITAAMQHADSRGITCQIQIRPNETNIYYHGKK